MSFTASRRGFCPINAVTILQDIVLAIVINTTAMLLSGATVTFASWYPGACAAFGTNVLIQLIVPVPGIGSVIARPARGHRILSPVISVFVENLIFVTIISFTMAVVQTSGVGLAETWLATYPALVAVGYATSLVLYAIVNRRPAEQGSAADC